MSQRKTESHNKELHRIDKKTLGIISGAMLALGCKLSETGLLKWEEMSYSSKCLLGLLGFSVIVGLVHILYQAGQDLSNIIIDGLTNKKQNEGNKTALEKLKRQHDGLNE